MHVTVDVKGEDTYELELEAVVAGLRMPTLTPLAVLTQRRPTRTCSARST